MSISKRRKRPAQIVGQGRDYRQIDHFDHWHQCHLCFEEVDDEEMSLTVIDESLTNEDDDDDPRRGGGEEERRNERTLLFLCLKNKPIEELKVTWLHVINVYFPRQFRE